METILFLAHTEADGSLGKAALEALGAAAGLQAALTGSKLIAGLAGQNVHPAANQIAGCGAVKFLGYFELNTNGAMTYVAYPTPPTVATVAAGSITTTNALLNAMINPNADGTTLYFQYGLTTSYGNSSVTNIVGTTSGSYGLLVSNLRQKWIA